MVRIAPFCALRFSQYGVSILAGHLLKLTILQDANCYQQAFSSDKAPTLYRAISAMEALCTRWEKKSEDPQYAIYHDAINAGLNKLQKYYEKIDNAPVYILAMCTYAMRYCSLDY